MEQSKYYVEDIPSNKTKRQEILCKMALFCYFGDQLAVFSFINPISVHIIEPTLFKISRFVGLLDITVIDTLTLMIETHVDLHRKREE